jgi:hypothetical protein
VFSSSSSFSWVRRPLVRSRIEQLADALLVRRCPALRSLRCLAGIRNPPPR